MQHLGNIGMIHFIGIGGIGMSGIAEILHNLGYRVQGSDSSESANVERLRSLGIHVLIGQNADHVKQASLVVISSAIKSDNSELMAARFLKIPVVRRAEMLAELMRLKKSIAIAGTHGKTTTTSLVGTLLESAHLDPTVVNGGIINAYGTNAKLGQGEWLVAESDESDGSFLRLPATIAVVTNIDPEHMDYYQDFDTLKKAFHTFVTHIPFYGCAIMCLDHPEVRALCDQIIDRRVLTYGFSGDADIAAQNVRITSTGVVFDVVIQPRALSKSSQKLLGAFDGEAYRLCDVHLSMSGKHNVQNSLVMVAVAIELGIDEAVLRHAMQNFQGVKRRFTLVGEVDGVSIIDDYAHHPVEIDAVLKAARDRLSAREQEEGRLVAVVQPHRYSRLASLLDDFASCFSLADHVIVMPVYSAGEEPIVGVSSDRLAALLKEQGLSVDTIQNASELAPKLSSFVTKGDMVVCLGAGNITHLANVLPQQLKALLEEGCAVLS